MGIRLVGRATMRIPMIDMVIYLAVAIVLFFSCTLNLDSQHLIPNMNLLIVAETSANRSALTLN